MLSREVPGRLMSGAVAVDVVDEARRELQVGGSGRGRNCQRSPRAGTRDEGGTTGGTAGSQTGKININKVNEKRVAGTGLAVHRTTIQHILNKERHGRVARKKPFL